MTTAVSVAWRRSSSLQFVGNFHGCGAGGRRRYCLPVLALFVLGGEGGGKSSTHCLGVGLDITMVYLTLPVLCLYSTYIGMATYLLVRIQ